MDPIRSRSSQTPSPSHSTASASASVTSSFHKRKLPPSSTSAAAASYPYFSDNAAAPASARDGAQDDLDTASARTIPAGGAAAAGGSFTSSEFEDAGDDDSDSMRVFTTARLESSGPAAVPGLRGGRPPKSENLKVEASAMKEERGGGHGSVGGTGTAVKEEAVKGIFTENIQTSGAYSAREEGHKREEDAGRLRFLCYANDGIDQHMIWLIGLKNIFARQLPNMPKEYIVRLVMDRSHKSMMVIRHNNVVGGITYRPYTSQKFGEIAFCAITGDEQVKGYGTRLMNHLKQHARDVDGLTHFLTYADNNAVGYFIKQGFTKEITFEKERWHGYIKDYDGGILMEYKIDPKLPYTDLSTMVRRQRQAIDERIRELSNCHIVYSGIDFQKKEAGIPRKLIKVEDIPGLREAGWTPDQWGHSRFKSSNVSADSSTYRQSLYSLMRNLLRAMIDHADAWPFKEPVDAREVPDYYDVIKDPMDLKIMSKRVDEQYYITLEMFIADARRMFANARTYNSPETIYYKCATRLEGFFSSRVHNSLAPGFKLQ